MELRHYYEVLRKRAWIIALLVIVTVGGLVYQVTSQPPQYQADVSILVRPQTLAPTAFEDTSFSAFQGAYRQTVINNFAYMVKSRAVLERVAEKLKLREKELAARVKVRGIAGTDFVGVTVKHPQPAQAALIANTTTQEFVSFYGQINRAEATSTRKFIEEQLGLARKRLTASEQALLEFRNRTQTVALPEEVSRMVQRALDMQAAYETALLEEKLARTRVSFIQSRLRSQEDPQLASISIATNPVTAQIRQYLTGLELELASARQVYTDQHPRVQTLQGRVAETRKRLGDEAAKVVSGKSFGVSPIREQFVREMVGGEVDAVVARARAAGVSRILGGIQARLNLVPKNELAQARLQRDVRVVEELFVRLSSLHQEALIRESRAGSSGQAAAVIVDLARIPERPVSAQLPMKAGLALMVALLMGSALALVAESMDDRIRSARQAEGSYGLPVLAAIPTMSPRTYRQLTTAQGVSSLLLSVIIVLLLGAISVGWYVGHAGATTDSVARMGQAVMQVLQAGR